MSKQLTLKEPFTLKGKGLHTGLNIILTVKPAEVNTGYQIKRIDLPEQPVIPALSEYVAGTNRGTVVKKDDVQVSTIEHCMAALYAAGIDNCLLEVNAPEFPILDGSAKYYVEAIERVGLVEQSEEKDYFVVTHKMVYESEDKQSSITLFPDDTFSAQVLISYDSPVLGNQYALLDDMSSFNTEIAPCRTFVFVREIEPLLNMNLIKGGDLNNAIVIYDREMPHENLQHLADLMNQPCPTPDKLGYLNTDLVFNNEPARHKLLDLIGDFSLIGQPIKGRIIAKRPGHKVNSEFCKLLRRDIKKQDGAAPVYSIDDKPVMDIKRIMSLLPHRYPFLLVDKVMELSDNQIIAIKNVTFNEMQFLGHFPDEPVMPGVLQVEAMAQTAGLLVLNQVDDPESYSTYFLKIDGVKFRQKVIPGDTMVMKVKFLSSVRRGLATVKGYVFVNGKIASEAELTAQVIKNK